MGFKLGDGKGRGYEAEVNVEQELVTRAITEAEIEHASSEGNAFAWDSTELDIDTGDTMLFIKNTDDVPLILDRVIITASNVSCTWTILLGTLTTTPVGTTVVGVNLNTQFSTKTADVVSMSDETALADGSIISRLLTVATPGFATQDLTGVIISKNGYVQVNQITESTSGSAILYGHFENPS